MSTWLGLSQQSQSHLTDLVSWKDWGGGPPLERILQSQSHLTDLVSWKML